MPYKWDENSTLAFLHAYKKHPCLWNPCYVKYYDCLAKNEALRNIIKELNISQLNISDCLEQIRVIREKYGQEQARIIKGLRSQKLYESPFAWYPVITEMLATVIDDEGKLQNGIGSKTVSHSKDYVNALRDRCKNSDTSHFPCAYEEVTKGHDLRKLQETKQDRKAGPRKNTKFTKAEHQPVAFDKGEISEKSKEKCYARLDLLLCPSCGWEDNKPEKLNATARRPRGRMRLFENAVLCPEYVDLIDKLYEESSNGHCRRITNDRETRNNNAVPCPGFSRDSPDTRYLANALASPAYRSRDARDCVNRLIGREATTVVSRPKLYTRETRLADERQFSERGTGRDDIDLERCNEGVQTTVCVSKANATSVLPASVAVQASNDVETDAAQRDKETPKSIAVRTSNDIRTDVAQKDEETRNESEESGEESEQINNAKKCDKEIQNTVCVSRASSTGRRSYEKPVFSCSTKIDAGFAERPKNMRDIIGIKLNAAEGVASNFILITTDENYAPFIRTDVKLQRLESDERREDKTRENQEEKIMQEEEAKTSSAASLLSKNGDVQSNPSQETTACEPCGLANENANFAASSVNELEKSSDAPCLEDMRRDNDVVRLVTTLLGIMKLIFASRNKTRGKNAQGRARRRNAIDASSAVLSEIKKFAKAILKMHTTADRLTGKSGKSCPRYRDKCPPETALSSIRTQAPGKGIEQFADSHASPEKVQVLYRPSTATEAEDHGPPEDHATLFETTTRQRSAFVNADEEIAAYTENRDVGSSALSLSRVSLRDAATQYTSIPSQDKGVVTERSGSDREKVSVGTQKREPIFFHLIQNRNGREISKSDKETYVCDVAWERDLIDEGAKTYPVYENMYRGYVVRERYDEGPASSSSVPRARQKEMSRVDLYRAALLSKKNYEKKCNSPLSYDENYKRINGSTFELSPRRRVSRIPLYARSHRYRQRRINLRRIAQSYV